MILSTPFLFELFFPHNSFLVVFLNFFFRYDINTAPNQLVDFPFELDQNTGKITTNRSLDRDEPNINFKWDFSVIAQNRVPVLGHAESISEAQVTIELIDENDHKPKIERMITSSGKTYQGKSQCSIYITFRVMLIFMFLSCTARNELQRRNSQYF